MNKKSLTKNKKLKVNRFDWGGASKKAFENATSAGNLGGSIGAVGGALGTIAEATAANAEIDTEEADNSIESIKAFKPVASDLNALSAYYNNAEFAKTGYTYKDFIVGTGEALGNMGKAAISGASAGAQVGGPWGAVIGGAIGLLSSGAGWAGGRVKAERAADRINRDAELANMSAFNKTLSARDSILENQNNEFMRNIVANGGKINIKPSKKGTFTAAAKQRGLGVQEFASKVLANKEDYSTAMIRKANFARNAKKWNHAYGGPLYNHTGDWSNGLIFVNEGGTHEENPYEGVLMGFDQEGVPNLVEEGEIIYNDYVFSNRLKPSKKQLESSGLNKKYNNWTFAKIVEDLQKSSAETPLDKISKESLDDMMATIINMQEEVRMKKGKIGQNRLMSFGGVKGRKYVGDEDIYSNPSYKGWNPNLIDQTTYNNSVLTSQQSGINPEVLMVPKIDISNIIKKAKEPVDFSSSELTKEDYEVLDTMETEAINTLINNSTSEDEKNFDWNTVGMYAPILSNAGKALYNAIKPIDTTNIVAEKAMREVPMMELPRLGGKQVYRGIDRNRLINPIINTSRATARDIQNNAQTAGQALANLANANYNTQRALGEAYLNADQQDLANRLQVAQFNLGIDQANANLSQAEQAANIARAQAIASGRIQDASTLEQLSALKGQAIDKTSTAVVQGLADLTRQNIEWNMIKENPEYAAALAAMRSKANGGMLTKRKRRR